MKKKSTSFNPRSRFLQASPLGKLGFTLFVLAFAIVGVAVLRGSFAESGLKPFVDNPARGWVWKDLRKGGPDSKCKDLYEVVPKNAGEEVSCTHGPDPAPDGVDVTKYRSTDQLVADTVTGTSGDSSGSIVCVDDGVAGNRVQAVYAVASDVPDRYNDVVGLIRSYAGTMDKDLSDSAAKTGGIRHIRWVTDPGCVLNVVHVVIPSTGDDSFSAIKSAVSKAGYNRTDRKYIIWSDSTSVTACGISNLSVDDRPTQDNTNNGGNSSVLYGAISVGCWGKTGATSHMTELHELTHLLGGVQPSAPHGTNYGHCTDEYDTMCYNDGALKSGAVMTYPCNSYQEPLLDCNNDDYFNISPLSGTYLASHWDLVNSSFLTSVGPGGVITTSDTTAPTIIVTAPSDGSTLPGRLNTGATGSDNVGVVKMEIYTDGTLRATSTTAAIQWTWSTRKLSTGSHTFNVKAYDKAGNIASTTYTVYK